MHRTFRSRHFFCPVRLVSLVLLSGVMVFFSCSASVETEEAEPEAHDPTFDSIAILGASASAGFGLTSIDGETMINLAGVLDIALLKEHGPIEDHTTSFFFLRPENVAEELVQRVREQQPTLIVALDYLFWFAYGMFPDDERRLEFLEKGLASLEEFEATILVSEVPNMSPAVGKMLHEIQVPDRGALDKVNARIREWVGGKPNVHLVPMAQFVHQLQRGESVRLRTDEIPHQRAADFLQSDDLHPTLEGIAGMAVMTLDALEHQGKLTASDARWDPFAIAEAYRELHRPAQE